MHLLRGLLLSGLVLTTAVATAQPPGLQDFGFDPGKKGILEGVVFTAGPRKGEKAVLHQLTEAAPFHCVVVYARQADDPLLGLVRALDAQTAQRKRCPAYFVAALTDAAALAEKTAKVEAVTVLRSYSRTTELDWDRLGFPKKTAAVVLLYENQRIKTRVDLKDEELTEERSAALLKQLTAFADELAAEEASGLVLKLAGHRGGARQLAFSPDGKWLYSHGADQDNGIGGRLKKWDVASGKEVGNAVTCGGSPSALGVTPDGKRLVTLGFERAVKLWDAETLKEAGSVPLPDAPMSGCLAPDGKRMAVGGRDKKVRVFDLAEKSEVLVLEGLADRVTAVAYSPDGKQLLCGDELGNMKLWDAATGKELAKVAGHTNTVNAIAFTADGKRAASGGREMRGVSGPGRARWWDVATGQEVRELESTGVNGVLAVALVNDGKMLVIAGESPVVKLIDLATGKLTAELAGHRSAVLSLAVSPDGATLASGDWFGPIHLWKVKKDR